MGISFIEKKNKTEEDFKQMTKNPSLMRDKWRARLRKSADAIAREKDPEKIERYQYKYYKQKEKLKEWEDKSQRRRKNRR